MGPAKPKSKEYGVKLRQEFRDAANVTVWIATALFVPGVLALILQRPMDMALRSIIVLVTVYLGIFLLLFPWGLTWTVLKSVGKQPRPSDDPWWPGWLMLSFVVSGGVTLPLLLPWTRLGVLAGDLRWVFAYAAFAVQFDVMMLILTGFHLTPEDSKREQTESRKR